MNTIAKYTVSLTLVFSLVAGIVFVATKIDNPVLAPAFVIAASIATTLALILFIAWAGGGKGYSVVDAYRFIICADLRDRY